MTVTNLTDFQPVRETIQSLEVELDRCRQEEFAAHTCLAVTRSRFATEARSRWRDACEATIEAERALTAALNEGRR